MRLNGGNDDKGASGDDHTSRWSAGASRSTFRLCRRLRGKPRAHARNRRGVRQPGPVGRQVGLRRLPQDEDRARTIKEASAQCNRPYVIAKGPTGGVMMNMADQKELSELILKAGPTGQTYLGPAGAAGGPDDRIVTNVDANSFTTVWVDPDNASRYGTSVYVRCGKR